MNLPKKVKLYREAQRAEMIYYSKKDASGRALCHLCGEQPYADMHEIINRAQTNANMAALQHSFAKELCALLCRDCHAVAMTRANELRLWEINVAKYGAVQVAAKMQAVIDALGFIPITEFAHVGAFYGNQR